jgi:hypothetical protein
MMADATTAQQIGNSIAGIPSLWLGVASTAIAILSGATAVWYVVRDRRMILKVRPGCWVDRDDPLEGGIRITVVNLSIFPVEITSCGFVIKEKRRTELYTFVQSPQFRNEIAWDEELPVTIQPRTSKAFNLPVAVELLPEFQRVRAVFVRTSCDEIRRGSSSFLNRLVSQAKVMVDQAE